MDEIREMESKIKKPKPQIVFMNWEIILSLH